jgi:hypothetical protein
LASAKLQRQIKLPVVVDAVAEVAVVVAPATEPHHWLQALIRIPRVFLPSRRLMALRQQLHPQAVADAVPAVEQGAVVHVVAAVVRPINRHSPASVHRDAAVFSWHGIQSRRRKRGEDPPDQVRDSMPAARLPRPATSSSRM